MVELIHFGGNNFMDDKTTNSTWQIFGGKLGRNFEDKLHVAIHLAGTCLPQQQDVVICRELLERHSTWQTMSRQKKQANFGAQQTMP
jgi:hypothetical protein